MTDRLFTACCYGSDQQHTAQQPCPQKEAAKAAVDAFNADPNRPCDEIDGVKHYHHARLPILATDCDYEVVSFSGVQGRRVSL